MATEDERANAILDTFPRPSDSQIDTPAPARFGLLAAGHGIRDGVVEQAAAWQLLGWAADWDLWAEWIGMLGLDGNVWKNRSDEDERAGT